MTGKPFSDFLARHLSHKLEMAEAMYLQELLHGQPYGPPPPSNPNLRGIRPNG